MIFSMNKFGYQYIWSGIFAPNLIGIWDKVISVDVIFFKFVVTSL